MAKQIETDLKTFIKFWMVPVGIAAIVFILYKALTGLLIIGISIFLALALKPLVHKVNAFFTRHLGNDKKHRTLSAVFAYLIVVLIVGAIVAVVGPVVVNETSKFVQHFPETFEKTLGGWDGINSIGRNFGIGDLQGEITKAMSGLSNDLMGMLGSNLISSVSGVADIMMKIALILVLTMLFLLEGPRMVEGFWKKVDVKNNEKKSVVVAKRIVGRMADVVSIYVSRQVVVAILDGCASTIIVFVLSWIFGFSQSLALPMGMITMTFYLIPMFGQFIGGTLVTILLFFSNPIAGLVFAVVYITYSQIENNVISPKIQGNALKLSPLVILCAVTVGVYMFGLLGAIIAIPIAGCIRVLVEEYPNIKAIRE